MTLKNIAVVLSLCLLKSICNADTFRVCTLEGFRNDCDQLARDEAVNCVINRHSVDCLLNIQDGQSDFGRISAEEAVLGASFISNAVVIGEFRADSGISEDSVYSTVVLVKSNTSEGFKNLRGKKFCHPGFKHENAITDLLLKEFEYTVIKENNAAVCVNSEARTLLEAQLKSIANFFGPSCRPGPWIDLNDDNLKFTKKYSSLCELCPNKNCGEQAAAPFEQSIKCLTENGGDIALTTSHSVNSYFNTPENIRKRSDYKYLCRNGQLNELNNPCIWSKQPWELIVAQKEKATLIQENLKEIYSTIDIDSTNFLVDTAEKHRLQEFLSPLFIPKDNKKIKFLTDSKSLIDYINGYRPIISVNDSIQCDRSIKWCTTSNKEQEKCNWLAQASVNRALQPVLHCVQKESQFSCIEDISKNQIDVFASDAHLGYLARQKKLASLAYPDTSSSSLLRTIVVINENSPIRNYQDLKNKKACIPEYGGIEWLSFINTARTHKVLQENVCDYGEVLSQFVGESCIPGSNDKVHTHSSKVDINKLCKLCEPIPGYFLTAHMCSANSNNSFYGNEGALKCLEKDGDFAVVTQKEYSNINTSNFRVLCKNGTLASMNGLNVDGNCALIQIVSSEVVSREDNSKNLDISYLLLNYERRFGQDRTKEFELFNPFHNTTDLLFQDSTQGLDSISSTKQSIQNYKKVFEHVDECVRSNNEKDSAAILGISTLYILSAIALLQRL